MVSLRRRSHLGSVAPHAPRQAAWFLSKSVDCGRSVATRPQVEPLLVVQEARVVYRSRLIAFVVRPEQDSVFHIRRNCKLLYDGVKDALRTISQQVTENNDDDVVDNVVARQSVECPRAASCSRS
jgi:hypothetical protein